MNYVLGVMLFAAVLFFAGMSTKRWSQRLRLVLLGLAVFDSWERRLNSPDQPFRSGAAAGPEVGVTRPTCSHDHGEPDGQIRPSGSRVILIGLGTRHLPTLGDASTARASDSWSDREECVMPKTAARPPLLSDEELRGLLELVKDADSVELKVTVPDSDRRSTVQALGMDVLDAQIRQVYFFDTPDLGLNQHGVVVRARRVQKRGDDSVIKLRPVVPSELSRKLRSSPNFVVEVDAMPGGYVCSGSLKNRLGTSSVQAVTVGGRPIRKLFSKEQRAFYAANAPSGLALDDLIVLGPVTVFKLKFSPDGYDRAMVAELWYYPDNSRILELSTKCFPGEALQVGVESRVFLKGRGVNLSGEQQTKTRTALEYFSREFSAT
jgi:hypothetical protein